MGRRGGSIMRKAGTWSRGWSLAASLAWLLSSGPARAQFVFYTSGADPTQIVNHQWVPDVFQQRPSLSAGVNTLGRFAVGDLDGNGSFEIVVNESTASLGRLHVFTYLAATQSYVDQGVFTFSNPKVNQGELAIGDLEGDGRGEVVLVPNGTTPPGPRPAAGGTDSVFIVDFASVAPLQAQAFELGGQFITPITNVLVDDVSGDDVAELVLLTQNEGGLSVDSEALGTGTIFMCSPQLGSTTTCPLMNSFFIESSPTTGRFPTSVAAGDLTGDGVQDLAIGYGSGCPGSIDQGVRVHESALGGSFPLLNLLAPIQRIAVTDVDGDDMVELLAVMNGQGAGGAIGAVTTNHYNDSSLGAFFTQDLAILPLFDLTPGEHCFSGASGPGFAVKPPTYIAATKPTDICDGADNDGDGDIDEDFRPFTVPCGRPGECRGGIPITCVGGSVFIGTCTGESQPTPEICDGLDNDCDDVFDDADPDYVAPTQICPGIPGDPVCATFEAPLACVSGSPAGVCPAPAPPYLPDACVAECASEVLVSTVPELRDAVAQAELTDCRDVIVMAPGVYDLFDQQLNIRASLEIRGQGSSFGCEGIDFRALTSSLSADLGAARCDGDDGEDPRATVITTSRITQEISDFQRLLDVGVDGTAPFVTLRHLTLTGGNSTRDTNGDEGVALRSRASRIQLFNVVVERNVARAPGAAIEHGPAASTSGTFADPSFIMVNSTVRDNRCTTGGAGGGGLQGRGGGMLLHSGTSSLILRSSIVNNAALRGGGIASEGRLHVFNSTISGNVAGEHGGGIWAASAEPTLLELHHTTVTNNVGRWLLQGFSEETGAGIAVRGAGNVQLHGSIVAGNANCTGELAVRCSQTEPCPGGELCQENKCVGIVEQPPIERTNMCTLFYADCSVIDGTSGAFESFGGNVADETCDAQSSFALPVSGEIASDVVTDFTSACSNDIRTPRQTEYDLFCYRGFARRSDVGGQIADPSQPVGEVPPEAGAPLLMGFAREETFLVGPLADNGGPTPTHAVPADSLAAGSSQTWNDPGDTTDAFPSSQPVCPVADQRGFEPAAGARPVVCDSGSFQTVPTSELTADELAQQLSAFSADTDDDGIADNVDLEPDVASFEFDDALIGGVTGGEITTLGDQVLLVFDLPPNPHTGLVAIALSQGGAEPAEIRACGGHVVTLVHAGEIQFIDCPNRQPDACVLATDQLTVRDRALLDVHRVLAGEGVLGQAVFETSVFAVEDLILERTRIAGDAVAGGLVVGAAAADIDGVVSEGNYLRRRTVALRDVAASSQSVFVDFDATLALPPGQYGALLVSDRGRLELSSGRYGFSSISFGNDATLELPGLIEIASEGSVTLGDRVRMVTPSDQPAAGSLVEWYTNASSVSIGHDVLWAGTLLAPLADVTIRDRTIVGGCLATRTLDLGYDTRVTSFTQLPLETAQGGGDATCETDDDCEGGSCVAGSCVPDGAGCTEQSAVDLGAPGQPTQVQTGGCVRINDGYPAWWGVRQMKLETIPVGDYPVPFVWTNECGGSGSGSFTGDWDAELLPAIDSACATVIDLQGSTPGTVTLRYWAQ